MQINQSSIRLVHFKESVMPKGKGYGGKKKKGKKKKK